MTYTSNIQGTRKSTKKGRGYIPQFYDFNHTVLGKDNYKLVSSNNQTLFYISPLLRTTLENIDSLNKKGQESYSRFLKEKLDSNSRLLIKKGSEKSKIVKIDNKEFIFVNVNIEKINDMKLRIYNDNLVKSSNII